MEVQRFLFVVGLGGLTDRGDARDVGRVDGARDQHLRRLLQPLLLLTKGSTGLGLRLLGFWASGHRVDGVRI